MCATLTDMLNAHAGAITEELALELQRSSAPHYREIDPLLLAERCRRLVEAFIDASGGDPAPFQTYVRELTQRRIAEGYGLAEIQRALVLLEERAWQLAIEESNVASLVRNLSIVTCTIGEAKDQLARMFLAHLQRDVCTAPTR